MIATHAVIARCPVCERPVRSTITLHAELADLQTRLCVADAGLESSTCSAAYDLEIDIIEEQLAGLQAELRGLHLLCSGMKGLGASSSARLFSGRLMLTDDVRA